MDGWMDRQTCSQGDTGGRQIDPVLNDLEIY
jgi:hypothetical protein